MFHNFSKFYIVFHGFSSLITEGKGGGGGARPQKRGFIYCFKNMNPCFFKFYSLWAQYVLEIGRRQMVEEPEDDHKPPGGKL